MSDVGHNYNVKREKDTMGMVVYAESEHLGQY